jgi:hypothetical protein
MREYADDHPELKRFSAVVDGTINRPEDIFEHKDALSALAQSDFVANFINSELRKAVDNEFYQLRAPILTGPGYLLTLDAVGLLPSRPPILWGSSRHQLHCVACDRAVVGELYERSVSGPEDVFSPAGQLTLVRNGHWSRGETVTLKSNRHFLCFEAAHPALMLGLSSAPVTNFRWLYRTNTLLPYAICPARTSSRKLELALVLAGALQISEASEAVSRFLDHDEFCVRWTALEAMVRIDRTAGLAALDRAVNDRHPEVRRRAENTINLIAEGGLNG